MNGMDFEWRGGKVLVTGATGFIGGTLVERLVRAGADVRAFVRYSSIGPEMRLGFLPADIADHVDIALGDITDPETVQRAVQGIDTIFHLAALIAIPYSYAAPRSYLRTNAEGSLNVLLAGRDARRIVHLSTSETYGTAQYVPMDELHPISPQSPYAASKAAGDLFAIGFHRSFQVPVTIARPFNTYGPRQTARAVIPTIIHQALDGTSIRLGSTRPTRDFSFVTDTADGLMRLAVADEAIGEVVNLGSGKEISIGGVVEMVGGMMGKQLSIEESPERLRPEASEVERLLSNNEKARRLLDWEPSVSLQDGLERTVRWIQQNRVSRPQRYEV
jgi:NAD dependent epimerase/dehydratase